MSLDLGWGLGRRGASRHFLLVHTAEERHSAPSSLVRPHPLRCCLLCRPAALQRAPPSDRAPPTGPMRTCDSAHPGARLLRPPCFSSSASSVLYGSTPPASLLVEDGRRPDDDVVICVVSPLGASKRRHSSRTAYNDPSAGSPTETLLRLLLPLDAGARRTSGRAEARPPDNSPQHPIGRSDGRCVQRAGTHSARDH